MLSFELSFEQKARTVPKVRETVKRTVTTAKQELPPDLAAAQRRDNVRRLQNRVQAGAKVRALTQQAPAAGHDLAALAEALLAQGYTQEYVTEVLAGAVNDGTFRGMADADTVRAATQNQTHEHRPDMAVSGLMPVPVTVPRHKRGTVHVAGGRFVATGDGKLGHLFAPIPAPARWQAGEDGRWHMPHGGDAVAMVPVRLEPGALAQLEAGESGASMVASLYKVGDMVTSRHWRRVPSGETRPDAYQDADGAWWHRDCGLVTAVTEDRISILWQDLRFRKADGTYTSERSYALDGIEAVIL